MEAHELRLWEILQRAGKGNEVSEDDLVFAENCLGLPPPEAQANACEILFRCSKSESARSRALDTAEQLCANAAEEDYVVTLLILMLYSPPNTFLEKPTFREFAVKCARSSRWQIRTNAGSVLQRFAQKDDEALGLLRVLASDSNVYVRENAQNSLRILGKSM